MSKRVYKPLISLIMGSKSDWETLKHTSQTLSDLGIRFEQKVISAHRTPHQMVEYANNASKRGIKLIIAGAGGAAHLPGMVAAITHLPVLGVPIESKSLKGLDSLLSIAQMPAGIPVGTLAIGKAGAINAALLAAQILGLSDKILEKKILSKRQSQTVSVIKKSKLPKIKLIK